MKTRPAVGSLMRLKAARREVLIVNPAELLCADSVSRQRMKRRIVSLAGHERKREWRLDINRLWHIWMRRPADGAPLKRHRRIRNVQKQAWINLDAAVIWDRLISETWNLLGATDGRSSCWLTAEMRRSTVEANQRKMWLVIYTVRSSFPLPVFLPLLFMKVCLALSLPPWPCFSLHWWQTAPPV